MAVYTYPTNATRATKAKGDIADAITNIAPDINLFLGMLSQEGTDDAYFQFPEDSFAAVDTENAHAEGADAPASSHTTRSLVDGYVQIMMKSVEVSDMQNQTAQYGIDKEFTYQKAKKLKELKRDAEAIALSDQAGQPGTVGNDRIWKMNGIGSILSSHTNTSFSESNFDSMIENIDADGGSPGIVLCDATRKDTISGWTTNITRFSDQEKRLEKEVLVYHAHVGPVLNIRHHRLMPVASGSPNLLMLENQYNLIKVMMDLIFKDLTDKGGGPRGLWKWIFGIGSKGEKAQGQFYDL